MTIIANPIYDVVFKYMMEDERVAKLLLSALLQKEVLSLKMCERKRHPGKRKAGILMSCIVFLTNVCNADGTENQIAVEFRKTWRITQTLPLRQYLSAQYLKEGIVPSREEYEECSGLPIVTIYILGHKLGNVEAPVIYVCRRHLNADLNWTGVSDEFIDNLPNDSIIVQIPYVGGNACNRLERLLSVFDQSRCIKSNDHLLEIDDDLFLQDEQILINHLIRIPLIPNICRAMDIEDELLSEIEKRDTTIMLQDKMIEELDKRIRVR